MINITVKTLDSQNHQFTVDENLTVEEFKSHIAESVNIPTDRQRIIYCGRVLQDVSKLSDYDVDGKVVHLVQRAPPRASSNSGNRPRVRSLTPPPDLNRIPDARASDRMRNAFYVGMGSMGPLSNLVDPQEIIPPRPTHTLSSSRLNVAKRMLRNAENVINLLENPTSTVQSEEATEEEVTPIIEARFFVPTTGNQPLDEDAIINAVQNTIFPSTDAGFSSANRVNTTSTSLPGTPRSASLENLNTAAAATATAAPGSATPSSNSTRRTRPVSQRCRGTEMAALVATLNQLQFRFAPFLAQYQEFMENDPELAPENVQQTTQLMGRVSKVLHYLGHAYHSLSDIIINVEQPPPRYLLCRPILVQPPAVLQAGIPIQVEAQINVSTAASSTSPATTTTTTTIPANSTTQQNNNSNSANVNRNPDLIPAQAEGSMQQGFVGVPLWPGASMRMFTAPVEIRTLRGNNPRVRQNNNNNTGNSAAATATVAQVPILQNTSTVSGGNNAAPSVQNQQPPPPPPPPTTQAQGSPNNYDFFMEVTSDALQSGNLVQSVMQLIGSQLGESMMQVQNQRNDNTNNQSAASNSTNNLSENSQPSHARSTQTNPTTATHTRSTPRPHVHMSQQSVPGGFDPFLHCSSHHVTQNRAQRFVTMANHLGRRRRETQENRGSSTSAAPSAPSSRPPPSASANNNQTRVEGGNHQPHNLNNIIFDQLLRHLPSEFVGNLSSLVPNNNDGQSRRTAGLPNRPSEAPPTNNERNFNNSDLLDFARDLTEQHFPDVLGPGPTLDVYVQTIFPGSYVHGENLLIDLIMLMLRNLRMNDLFMLSSGNMTPLQTQLSAIRNFILTEVCRNDTSTESVNRAIERLMVDLTPILAALQSVRPKDDIDMVNTIDGFFVRKLGEIIQLAIDTPPNSEESVQDVSSNILFAIWRAIRDGLAIAIHCSANGQQGVEDMLERLISVTLFRQHHANVPDLIHEWTGASSRRALRTLFDVINIPYSEIEQYIIKNDPNNASAHVADDVEEESMQQDNNIPIAESMDVDIVAPLFSSSPMTVANADVKTEFEPWHNSVPAEWIPIISHDVQTQKNANSQPAFSDAYINGMPSKRRKIINDSKPPQESAVSQVISESLRRALTETGLSLSAAAPLDIVVQTAGESADIQNSYRNLLRNSIQNNLRNNEDFTPERYPNVARYFNESSQE